LSKAARFLALASALAVATALASPLGGPGSKTVSTNPVSTVSVTARDTAAKAKDSAVAAAPVAPTDTLSKPKIDSSDLKQLPPRALPLKQQMMFAGGFMIFVAVMLTSMQNFNPND